MAAGVRNAFHAAVIVGGATVVSAQAYAEGASTPKYKLSADNRNVVELSNLAADQGCHPSRFSGLVVKRSFNEDALTLKGIVIEQPDGSREFINVSPELDDASMVTRGWVVQGLQTLLKEGRAISGVVKLCGAAGRVMLLDQVSGAK